MLSWPRWPTVVFLSGPRSARLSGFPIVGCRLPPPSEPQVPSTCMVGMWVAGSWPVCEHFSKEGEKEFFLIVDVTSTHVLPEAEKGGLNSTAFDNDEKRLINCR